MASSCESGVLMATVCQTCGDKGDLLLLIYCVQCHDSAMHHYCLDKFSPDDDNITWMCEECTAKAPQIGPSMKSERINSRKDQAVEVRNNWEKRPSKKGFSTAKRPAGMKNELFKAAKLTGCSLPNEDKFHVSFDETCGSQECRIQRRRLMLEDGDSSEEPELAKANISQSDPSVHMSYCQPSLEPDSHLYAQPVNDPIWRGCLSITSGKNETLFGLVAHISSKACSKVFDAANALPPVLNVEILPRSDVWPKSFQKLPPTDDSIALYFFPDSERDEKVFEILFLGYSVCREGIILCMEFCEGGTLWNALRTGDEYQWYNRGRLAFTHVCKGLYMLHANQICHLDMKTPNVLISNDGTCKISDLGLSKMMKGDVATMTADSMGTLAWMAPEQITGRCGLSSDIWALSTILWEICTVRKPSREAWPGEVKVPEEAPQWVVDLMTECRKDSPKERPTIAEICQKLTDMEGAEPMSRYSSMASRQSSVYSKNTARSLPSSQNFK